mmetsp:Transcript_8963/g.14946  ORF Transcript_8963/g.14946 Transcript_8963/m.14946 type:complete len:214 (-) Transcript_8963:4-645(-)
MNNIQPGSKVKIVGLKSEEGLKLNGQEGIIDHFSRIRERYAISLPGFTDLKMIKENNLELLEATKEDPVFANEAEMMARLKAMGMPAEMLTDLSPAQKKQMFEMTQRQGILERATEMAGVRSDALTELKNEGVYAWRDASDHVYLEVELNGKKPKVYIAAESIHIKADGATLLQGNLFQKVNARESKWEVKDDGKLAVTLKKVSTMRWLMVVR